MCNLVQALARALCVASFAASFAGAFGSTPVLAQIGREDLGDLAFGGSQAGATGVDGSGTVVIGSSDDVAGTHPFRWTPATGLIPLGATGSAPPLLAGTGQAISADGSTLVGLAVNGAGLQRAFRWTTATGYEDLGSLNGNFSSALAANADGSVVVGYSSAVGGVRAVRWTAATGMQDLGHLGGNIAWAQGVSADGAVVVGWSLDANARSQAFRWTAATGMQAIVLGQAESRAYGVSADGSVVVGAMAQNVNGGRQAYRWTAATGVQGLGSLGGDSIAHAVSADGAVIVGSTGGLGQQRAFRWTAATSMTLLGTLGGNTSSASGVNADGSVVVGSSTNPLLRPRACRWTLSGEIGELVCTATATNSTGGTARLVAVGTNILLIPEFRLRASGLPTNTTAFVIVSRASAVVPNPAGSQGTLCLGGAIGRLVGPGQVQNTGATGTFELVLDPRSLPTPSGIVPTQAGERWVFQAWHRDANPGPTSNFTDAVGVTWR